MATSTYGTPYVQGSDLVSAYPTVSSSLATRVDEVSYKGNGLNAQTGTTYTLVVGDAGKTITLSNASPVAVTLPQDSTADLPDGAVVTFYNLGAGTVTISQGTGATLQGGSISLAQYAVTSIIKLSANTYGKFDGSPSSALTLISPTSIAFAGTSATSSAGTTTINSCSSVSLNGVFSGTYENYLVTARLTATDFVLCRMRATGTDATTGYVTQQIYAYSSTVGTTAPYTNGFAFMYSAVAEPSFAQHVISGPYLAAHTRDSGQDSTADSTTVTALRVLGGALRNTTQYDGISLVAVSGNMTGTLRVYGYEGA